jgi:hypothetical protein
MAAMSRAERLVYEVAVTLAPGTNEDEYGDWMRDHHIPALLATRCFNAAEVAREDGVTGRYRTRYFAVYRAGLERYLREHAPKLRDDFQRRFGSGAEVRRETWELLDTWA